MAWDDPILLVGLAGVVVGALLGFLIPYLAWRPAASRARAAEAEVAGLRAEEAALRVRAERVPGLEADLKAAQANLGSAEREVERFRATSEQARRSHEERVAELKGMSAEMARQFDALAADALGKNSERFLGLVSERFTTHKQSADDDLTQRHAAIESLVKPLTENLDRLQALSSDIEKQRLGAYSAVVAQVQALADTEAGLRAETGRLVRALRRPQTRGRWGEYQLRNVLEMTGMTEHADFVTQQTIDGEDGKLRPDAVVRLPGGKFIVVDAKTPLDAYLSAIEAEDELTRDQALGRHARQVQTHLLGLSAKEYWRALSPSPDFVVMFIPGEPMYAAAVERAPTLFEDGLRANVLIVTPVTFVALIKAIAYGWQQEKLAANSQQLANLGRDLYERVSAFGDHMRGLGKTLGQAVDRFNKSVGTLEARVLPAARKFEQTGVVNAAAAITPVASIDREVRELQSPEFVMSAEPRISDPLSESSPPDAPAPGMNGSNRTEPGV